jgi:hypothetical protein
LATAFAKALASAAALGSGRRGSNERLRQTRITSSWIGSLARDFGAATDISAFTGWALTMENLPGKEKVCQLGAQYCCPLPFFFLSYWLA